VQGLDFP